MNKTINRTIIIIILKGKYYPPAFFWKTLNEITTSQTRSQIEMDKLYIPYYGPIYLAKTNVFRKTVDKTVDKQYAFILKYYLF